MTPSPGADAPGDLLRGNLDAAALVATRLRAARDALAPMAPFTPEALADLPFATAAVVDSLLLGVLTLAGLVQDQTIRSLLLAQEEDLLGTSLKDRRLRAEKLGALRPERDLGGIAVLRNRLAQTYAADRARQAAVVNEVFERSSDLLAALDDIRDYVAARLPPTAGTG